MRACIHSWGMPIAPPSNPRAHAAASTVAFRVVDRSWEIGEAISYSARVHGVEAASLDHLRGMSRGALIVVRDGGAA